MYQKESLKNSIEIYPFAKRKSHQTILVPIVPNRLSEKIEQQWFENEKDEKL
jgi:methylmalonyl-CoA mutase